MNRPRLIPVLILKNGRIVRSQGFRTHQVIGNPMSTVERFSNWNVDELILLDISVEDFHDLGRDDLQQRYHGKTTLDVLREISKVCFMPLAFGGRIRTLGDIADRLSAGADRCVINTKAVEDPDFVAAAARRFGSQCVIVSIDAKKGGDGRYEVVTRRGTHPTGQLAADWARCVEERGAGEIFLNSIDRDGAGQGYDIDLIRQVTGAVSIPVIACGGVGTYGDFARGIVEGGADAVAAANIFHFLEMSYPLAKQGCLDAGLPMRPVKLGGRWFQREPQYDRAAEDGRIAGRLARAASGGVATPQSSHVHQPIRWCSRCVLPSISAAPLEFDSAGVCTGCLMAQAKEDISVDEWGRRREILRQTLDRYRSPDGSRHDCIIAVSGGKDSYFQTHVIKNELGMNPLLVTYNGNNYTAAGWRNLMRMKDVFDVDHVIVSPSVTTLKKLNRLAFVAMGDMNWHAHVGITTIPVQVAAQQRISLVIWGEHGYTDQSGQFTMYDFPEMTYRDRLEHFARGFEWTYFVDREGLSRRDLIPWKYPTDDEIFEVDIRGLYLGNYVHWEANDHGPMVIEKYGFEVSAEPFDRTYRVMSNLDDMHENGVHDYLKFIKFGYGRCTDHATKDIRAGLLDRAEAIARVRRYDHVKPRDLERWCTYVGMTESEFDRIADTFRDPRAWRREGTQWVKDNVWGRDG